MEIWNKNARQEFNSLKGLIKIIIWERLYTLLSKHFYLNVYIYKTSKRRRLCVRTFNDLV